VFLIGLWTTSGNSAKKKPTKTTANNASRNKKVINAMVIRSHHVDIERFAGGAASSFEELEMGA